VKVENFLDDLWIGVKDQSNSVIAGSPRNILRYSLGKFTYGGRALTGLGAPPGYQTLSNSECRKLYPGSQTAGDKVRSQKGNSPDRRLRSPNSCSVGKEVES
jgi:hypothetical protein